MKKALITICIVAVIALFGGRAWYLHKQAATEKDVVKIGLILPLSGDASRDGQEALLAAKMAQEEINQTSPNKVVLKSEDSKFASKTAISAFNKLYGEGVDSVVVFGDVPSLATIPLLKDEPIPMFSMAGAGHIPSMSPWVFRIFVPVHQLSKVAVNYFTNNLKIKRVAFLYIKEPICEQFLANFKQEIEKQDGEITAIESFKMSDLDTKAQVTKVLATNPEGVYVYGFGPGYVSALNYLKQMRYSGIIMTDFNIVPNQNLLVENGKGILFMDFDLKQNRFAQKFYEKHGVYPNIFSTFIYESVRVFNHVIQPKQTKEITREELANLKDFKTGVGNISFNAEGEISGIDAIVIKQFQPDGTAKIVKE